MKNLVVDLVIIDSNFILCIASTNGKFHQVNHAKSVKINYITKQIQTVFNLNILLNNKSSKKMLMMQQKHYRKFMLLILWNLSDSVIKTYILPEFSIQDFHEISVIT